MCLKKPRTRLPKQSLKLPVTDRIRIEHRRILCRRMVALTLVLVASITGIALAQSHHHDANSSQISYADATFASQMMQAMDRMDSAMMAAKPTNDPDRDFRRNDDSSSSRRDRHGEGGINLRA